MTRLNQRLKDVIVSFHKNGQAIIPLNDKIPVRGKWQQTEIKDFNIDDFQNSTSAGFVIPKDIVIVDVDNHDERNKGSESLEKFNNDHGFNLYKNAGIAVQTANKGLHLYYRIPSHVKSKLMEKVNGYEGLEFKTKGRYVVLPESIIEGSKKYSFSIIHENKWSNLISLPENIISTLKKGKNNKSDNIEAFDHPSDIKSFKDYIQSMEKVGEGSRNNTVFIIAAEGKEKAISQNKIFEYINEEEVLVPPLDKNELKRTIKSAFDNEEIETGAKSVVKNFGADFIIDDRFIPESLRSFVNDSAFRLQCSKDAIFAGLVVTLSSLVASKFSIQTAQNDYEHSVVPNLWGMVVADPGTRKSSALKKSIDLLKPLEKRANDKFKQEVSDYNKKSELAKQNDKKFSEPEPVLERFIINDATVEKIGDILSKSPNSKLIFRDELIGFLEGLEKNSGKSDKAFFLESWNGDASYRVDRVIRGSILIENLCFSIIGTTQPKTIANYFHKFFNGSVNDGFIQRFQVVVCPETSSNLFKVNDVPPNKVALENVEKIIESIYDGSALKAMFKDADIEFDRARQPVRFSLESQAVYNKWIENLINFEVRQEDSDLMKEHLMKYQNLVPSLALIFHLSNVVSEGKESKDSGFISKKALEMAIEYSKYLKAHAKKFYLFGSKSKKEDHSLTMSLLRKIKDGKLGKEFFTRDVIRKEWSGMKNKADIDKCLDSLENDCFLTTQETKRSLLYKVNFVIKGDTDTTDS